MTTINIDKEKVGRMVRKTLQNFDNTGAHPAECIIALSESIGRIIASLPANDITKRDLLDMSIKHTAGTIEASMTSSIVLPN